jgi:hypothetical protein
MAAQALTVVPERDIPRMVSFGGACVGCDLSGRQLSGARFQGADFSGSVLIGADLRDASLTGADFSRSDLSSSDLTGADITGADFEGARLREVRLDRAWIRGVSFSGSDLEGASLRGVVFSGVDLSGARNLRQEQLDAACASGSGFDVYFDNVGGPLLDAVLTRMNHYGRIAVCGLLANYTAGTRTAPAEFDQVLMRRLRIEGFFSPDFMHEGPALTERLRAWHEAGDLVMPYDVTQGLEHTLTAYAKLFTGGNIGKVIVELNA